MLGCHSFRTDGGSHLARSVRFIVVRSVHMLFCLVGCCTALSPTLAPCRAVIRNRWCAVLVFSSHGLCHCSFALVLICWVRHDFIRVCLNGLLAVGMVAACFASWSACSFPSMPLCPGIHVMFNWCSALRVMRSRLSRIEVIMDCPDWRPGFWTELHAA